MEEKDKTMMRAEDFLRARKWTKFLLAIPLERPKGYLFESGADMTTIRVITAQMNNNDAIDRRFTTSLDFSTNVATITAFAKDKEE